MRVQGSPIAKLRFWILTTYLTCHARSPQIDAPGRSAGSTNRILGRPMLASTLTGVSRWHLAAHQRHETKTRLGLVAVGLGGQSPLIKIANEGSSKTARDDETALWQLVLITIIVLRSSLHVSERERMTGHGCTLTLERTASVASTLSCNPILTVSVTVCWALSSSSDAVGGKRFNLATSLEGLGEGPLGPLTARPVLCLAFRKIQILLKDAKP